MKVNNTARLPRELVSRESTMRGLSEHRPGDVRDIESPRVLSEGELRRGHEEKH
jgi:hypothetical protein